MTPLRLLATSALSLALASCAANKADDYDTANPYGTADATPYQAAEPANPVYDTPAAYEETTGAPASAAAVPSAGTAYAAPSATPAPSPTGPAIIHTVVAGDTLSGISSKYKVPSASIKQANGMTTDVVVLGKKMVIPPTR